MPSTATIEDLRAEYRRHIAEAHLWNERLGEATDGEHGFTISADSLRSRVIRIVDQRLSRRYRFYTGCSTVWGDPEREANFPESVPTPADWVQAAEALSSNIKHHYNNFC